MLSVYSAYDETLLESLPFTPEEEIERFLAQASRLHERRAWLAIHERRAILERLVPLLEANCEELARGIAQEGGKPLIDARIEAQRAAEGVRVALAQLWTRGGREVPLGLTPSSTGRWAVTHWEPRGPVLGISAFNHPLNLIVHQVIPAVASGCPVLIKPASTTPLSCRALLNLLSQAGLPPEWAQMVLLSSDAASRLVQDPRLRFFSFIGSAEVGFQLQRSLAPGVSAALEHGGVAPVLVDETADLDRTIPALLKGAYYHAGQVCVSVQRIYVARKIYAEFRDRWVAAAQALHVGDPCEEQTEVGPLIQPKEVERVDSWVQEAVQAGAQLLCGGERLSRTTYAPTALAEPPEQVRVSQKEIFGPVVALYPFASREDAVRRANALPSYFQAAVFAQDLDVALELSRKLNGTTVLVNDHTAFRVDWMPFGGVGPSGLSRGGIPESMQDMSLERLVVFRSPQL